MPELTYDWSSPHFEVWEKLIPVRENVGVLEIGCFEGRSTLWFLNRFKDCAINCVDTFEGSLDHKQAGIDFSQTEARFDRNMAPWRWNVRKRKGKSAEVLRSIKQIHDIILIDGSHVASDVFQDIALSWPLLRAGGYMILDDYDWGKDRPIAETPKPAIDAFLQCFEGQYEILEKRYQVILRKL